MSIKIRYFASLKDAIGRSEDILEYSPGLNAQQLWQASNPNTPLPDNILVAINMDYVPLSTLVEDGDEVAFFPPVTGG